MQQQSSIFFFVESLVFDEIFVSRWYILNLVTIATIIMLPIEYWLTDLCNECVGGDVKIFPISDWPQKSLRG